MERGLRFGKRAGRRPARRAGIKFPALAHRVPSALDEIAAIAGIATDKPKRPPVPEGYALKTAALVATVRKGAP
jgi:hypothetical protein